MKIILAMVYPLIKHGLHSKFISFIFGGKKNVLSVQTPLKRAAGMRIVEVLPVTCIILNEYFLL
jgi:hypothetical protein